MFFAVEFSCLTCSVCGHYIFITDDSFSDVNNFHKTLVTAKIHINFLWRDLNQCKVKWEQSELVNVKCIVLDENLPSDNSYLVCSRDYGEQVVKWPKMSHAPWCACCFAL